MVAAGRYPAIRINMFDSRRAPGRHRWDGPHFGLFAASKFVRWGSGRGVGSAWGTKMKDAVWAICERVAEVKALIEDHLEHGKFQTNEVPLLINEILSEEGLREAMLAVGYQQPKPARH
jgi:hypothetical protein